MKNDYRNKLYIHIYININTRRPSKDLEIGAVGSWAVSISAILECSYPN